MTQQGTPATVLCTASMAAVLTPPDVISQLMLAVPMLLLYEISIYLVRRFEKRRAEKARKQRIITIVASVVAVLAVIGGIVTPDREKEYR